MTMLRTMKWTFIYNGRQPCFFMCRNGTGSEPGIGSRSYPSLRDTSGIGSRYNYTLTQRFCPPFIQLPAGQLTLQRSSRVSPLLLCVTVTVESPRCGARTNDSGGEVIRTATKAGASESVAV